MSGYASFYRPRILTLANIPQIEEGSIIGYISLYSITPSVQVITVNVPSVALDTGVVSEAPLSLDLGPTEISALVPTSSYGTP